MRNYMSKVKMTAMSLALITSTLFIGTSCSDKDDLDATGYSWNVTGNKIVNIKPERSKFLRNPLQGWNIYTGIGSGMMDNFWDIYDNFDSSEGKVKVSDYGTTLYIRGAWSDFNPEEGVYIWQDGVNTEPAKRFRMLVNGAKERNLKLAFTFVVDSRDKHYNFTPDYVREAGCKGYVTTTGSVQVWSPYPDDPIFQEKYAKFLQDFAAKYNDPDLTNYVSGFGLGKWGETHTLKYWAVDNKEKTEKETKYEVFEWITDLMAKTFTKVPIFINYHRCLLSSSSFDGANLDDTADLIDRAVKKGFSLRHDAFGMKQYYKDWERGIATTYRYQCPFIMEGGWVKSSHGSSIKGDGYADYAEVRKGEFDEGKGANVNMMDFRFSSSPQTGETHSWFNSAFKLVKEFIADGGYRLYPDKVSLPENASSNGKVVLTHRWSNLGWGYCPTNLPQWNQKYKVAFALLDKTTEKSVKVFVDPNPEISDWVQGTPHTYKTELTLSDVTPGQYEWAVGIVDTTKDNAIGIIISARDEYQTEDGWVKLSDVTIK
nr:DUF4832 domain-containing protein [uncultured Prevotella sp.]